MKSKLASAYDKAKLMATISSRRIQICMPVANLNIDILYSD